MPSKFSPVLKFILKFFLFLTVIGVIVYSALYGTKVYKQHQTANNLKNVAIMDPSLSADVLLQEAPDEDFDDDGLTNEKEASLKTDPFNQDTDNDGVKDGEEVTLYHSNPLKFSTANDDISDGIKIIEQMDVNKKAKVKIDSFTLENKELNATLTSQNLNTKYLSHMEKYPMAFIQSQIIGSPLLIQNTQGELTLSYGEVNTRQGQDITAYFYDPASSSFTKIKKQTHDKSSHSVSFSIDTMSDEGLFAEIISHSNITDHEKIVVLSSEDLTQQNTKNEYYLFRMKSSLLDNGYFGILIGFNSSKDPNKMQWFANNDTIGIYVDGGNLKSKVLCATLANIFTETDRHLESQIGIAGTLSYLHFEETYQNIKTKYLVYLADSFGDLLAYAEKESQNTQQSAEIKITHPNMIDSGFNPKVNGFNFANLSPSDVSSGGICAGLSYVSQLKWNGDGTIPAKKEYSVTGLNKLNFNHHPDFGYDLSQNPSVYQPLLSGKNLYDYIPTDGFVTEEKLFSKGQAVSYSTEDISQPDQSMVEMLELYYAVGNSSRLDIYSMQWNNAIILDKLEAYLASGKVAYVSLVGPEGGHAIVGYKIEKNPDNPNEIILYVYDVNFPGGLVTIRDKETSKIKTQGDYTESFKIYIHNYSKKELQGLKFVDKQYFSYDYAPLENYPAYSWESSKKTAKHITFRKTNGVMIKETNTVSQMIAD